jgi:hypothetical protein
MLLCRGVLVRSIAEAVLQEHYDAITLASPHYPGVNAIRLVVRSTQATVCLQTHWSKIPDGSEWAANDARVCWYSLYDALHTARAGPG